MSVVKQDLNKLVTKAQARSNQPIAVVVNTGDANSYGIVVNLGRMGVPVISVSPASDNITFHSRYAQALLCPHFDDAEADFIDTLVELGQQISPKPVLLVNGDEPLMSLLRNRDRLERHYRIPLASHELAETLTDKAKFYAMLVEHDVPHATTYYPKSLSEVEAFAGQLQYPYIIKPSQSQTFTRVFGNKCLSVNSPEELLETYTRVAAEEDGVIVQKQILGTERYLVYTYFTADSEPLGLNAYRKLRIFPTDFGNACACETVFDEALNTLYLDLLRKIEYKGLAEAEFQRDAGDGQLKLTEINARSTTQNRLSERSGVNMEYIAYQDALGREQTLTVNREAGIRWFDLYRDILSVFSSGGYRAQGKISIGEWWRSLQGKRIFAFFSWDDPMPAAHLLLRIMKMHVFNRKRLSGMVNTLTRRSV